MVYAPREDRSAWDPSPLPPPPPPASSLIRVFVVRLKKAWILSYPLSAQRRLWSDWADTLIRLGGCPGWSESSLGAHAILLVLSRCASNASFLTLTMHLRIKQENGSTKNPIFHQYRATYKSRILSVTFLGHDLRFCLRRFAFWEKILKIKRFRKLSEQKRRPTAKHNGWN